ncbi:Protein TIFY 4B [Glycine soja]|nr:Protein TIFY 4B [Glycine soja]
MSKTRVRTGMRRPSWNKSQAIQQVISLKALLEPSDDDTPPPPPPAMHHRSHAQPQPQVNLSEPPPPPPKAPPPEEPAFHAAEDIQKSASSGEKPTETNDTNTNVASPKVWNLVQASWIFDVAFGTLWEENSVVGKVCFGVQ